MSQNTTVLTPAQEQAAQRLQVNLTASSVCVLSAGSGFGKTTILRRLLQETRGTILSARNFTQAIRAKAPDAIEEALHEMVEDALVRYDLVVIDDLDLITEIMDDYRYKRPNVMDIMFASILDGLKTRQRLVFATAECVPYVVSKCARTVKIADFEVADYEAIFRAHLAPGSPGGIDLLRVHRFAPKLTARQLSHVCAWLNERPGTSTDQLIAYLHTEYLASNVELAEVQAVDWKDLKGVDEVIRALEAKIALPFENPDLAAELGLKPKRGVLLAGPPGTGKTTIGRALAHRLKSKFFMIDGTVISGSDNFYQKVDRVFRAAKQNAPSIVFIDDADVIFEGEGDRGLYRYLLTILDGLESASAERVCVMMTAMHVGSLPPAIVRSGRIELWLETKHPDVEAREAILSEKIAKLPSPLRDVPVRPLAEAARGLTGADLKTSVEDAKLLYAFDLANSEFTRAPEQYFAEAIRAIRAARRKYGRSKPPKFVEGAKIGFEAVPD